MGAIGEMTLEDAAREAAGNWRWWTCFVWDREHEIDDPESWAIIYTHNRDSGLLDQSNADVIAKTLRLFTTGDRADVVFESHSHWAVGHVDGFSIRVYRDGEITDAFRTYHDLSERLAGYPILDESDYSEREHRCDPRQSRRRRVAAQERLQTPRRLGEPRLFVARRQSAWQRREP